MKTYNIETTDLEARNVIARIWKRDYTVWNYLPAEVSNRLGWLDIAKVMKQNVGRMTALAEAVRADGYTHALLLGMGGSSLAPEVFRKTFDVREGHLDLAVLDSTDPGAVLAYDQNLDLSRTLFIVSTKSGGTVETLSFFKFFYNRVAEAVGTDDAGRHFIAITDIGSKLADLAERCNFRQTFINDSNIGGRYSALSYFGMVPATLVGVDVETLLDRAIDMMTDCSAEDDNPAAGLGAAMGMMALAGRDKLTLIASPPIAAFGAWAEQLIAESTGKDGKGILPVDGETLSEPDAYGNDRLFVYLRLDGDDTHDTAVQRLIDAGQPVVRIGLQDHYDLGGELFRWEMATAVAGHFLGINPFDQPNVELAKVLAREMVAAYMEEGELPYMAPKLEEDGITVYSIFTENSLDDMLSSFLQQTRPGDYIAIQAYVQPTAETDAALQELRIRLRDQLKVATTVGYGPRFLHSTGQLHKGDAGRGLFIQFTSDNEQDVFIPDEAGSTTSSMSFGVLKSAQALGDLKALLNVWRRVIRFHLGTDVVGGLKRLMGS
ncbi:glucose-6-phosphate isomerase [Candidatus Poribacteria bacterium]